MNDQKEENKKKIFKKIPGCDLGTTNSAIAFSSDGSNIEVIANELGGRTTPSLIYFSPNGQIMVGENARKFMQTEPERVVYEVKRLIGRKFDEPSVQDFMKKCTYKIVKGPQGEALVKIGQQEYSPVQLSAFILQEMKKTAQNRLSDQSIHEIVITVPAHFNDAQRQATKDAGTVAGLKVERIINEPTAAALAYGLDKGHKKELIAVFDLGGGTFDISIIEIDEGVFTVKATNGDTWLGGSDFDSCIVQWLIDKTKEKLKVNLTNDNLALQRFKDGAISAKHQLSREEVYEFNLPFLAVDEQTKAPLHLQVKLLRKEFEDIVNHLLQRMVKPCQQCLKDASVEKVDKVILVGGMTRIPSVQKIAEKIFKLEPNKSVNPDEAVAIGAAIQGSVLTGSSKDLLLLDVNPLSVGLETLGGINTIMIPRNTTIPITKPEFFSTAFDNQETVTIKVIEGEGAMANSSGNKVLNIFDLTGIKPAPKGKPQIEVEFSIDANGILSVRAKDKETGKEQKVVITGRTKNEEEMQRMIKEAKEREEEDKKLKEDAELKIEADSLCYTIKKNLDKFTKNNLQDEPQYKELEKIYEELKKAVDTEDNQKIKQQLRVDNVSGSMMRLSNELEEKMPKESSNAENSEPTPEDNTDNNKTES